MSKLRQGAPREGGRRYSRSEDETLGTPLPPPTTASSPQGGVKTLRLQTPRPPGSKSGTSFPWTRESGPQPTSLRTMVQHVGLLIHYQLLPFSQGRPLARQVDLRWAFGPWVAGFSLHGFPSFTCALPTLARRHLRSFLSRTRSKSVTSGFRFPQSKTHCTVTWET